MCTAIRFKTKDCYFGRNLDLDRSYGEEVCVMPRHYPISFRKMGEMQMHYAMIGMATVVDTIPLFYDAVNEYGLAMAGLNFPGNAYYPPFEKEKDNIAPFEFILWILGQCKTIKETKVLLERINLINISFSEKLPLSPLHWIIADREASIVVESCKSRLFICENPVDVLTNNPPFEYQLLNLQKYKGLSVDNAEVKKEEKEEYISYSQGLGAVGLPGDVSSKSRFVRAVFGRENAVCSDDELSSVGQFFHLLNSVEMIRGICKTDEGTWDITDYSACMNLDKGLYYYTTYNNHQITCVNMQNTNLDSEKLCRFPIAKKQSIYYCN